MFVRNSLSEAQALVFHDIYLYVDETEMMNNNFRN